MKKLFLLILSLVVLSCTTETVTNDITTADAKANVERKGKGKPQRAVYLKPSLISNLRAFNGRIMEEPVTYTGDTLNLPQTIDFDNDGTLDEVTIVQKCFFPRTFLEIVVNGEVVNYSTNYGAKVLGFKDVNLDGFTDIIFEGGNSYAYNDGEIYSQYNVGYNVEGSATPLKDIIQSLVIDTSDPNPEYIKWDLSAHGINHFAFHVKLYNKNNNDGYGIQQTHTYGEFGFYSLNRLTVGETYILEFTNLDDCSSIIVEFTL